jgi:hypothetical protein
LREVSIVVRSAIPSTAAGLKRRTSKRPREKAHGNLCLALARLREIVGGLHPMPHAGAGAAFSKRMALAGIAPRSCR